MTMGSKSLFFRSSDDIEKRRSDEGRTLRDTDMVKIAFLITVINQKSFSLILFAPSSLVVFFFIASSFYPLYYCMVVNDDRVNQPSVCL